MAIQEVEVGNVLVEVNNEIGGRPIESWIALRIKAQGLPWRRASSEGGGGPHKTAQEAAESEVRRQFN